MNYELRMMKTVCRRVAEIYWGVTMRNFDPLTPKRTGEMMYHFTHCIKRELRTRTRGLLEVYLDLKVVVEGDIYLCFRSVGRSGGGHRGRVGVVS